MDLKKVFYEEINYLKYCWGTEYKIKVYSTIKSNREFLRSYLLPADNIEKELTNENIADIVYQPRYIQINNNIIYKNKYNHDDIEPIIIERRFNGLKVDSIELTEEFRLLFNLYYDLKTQTFMDLEHRRTVVEFKEDGVYIDQYYLRIYLGIKQKVLVLFKDKRLFFTEDSVYKKIKGGQLLNTKDIGRNFRYSINIGAAEDCSFEYKYFSTIFEKKIILPIPLEGCGIWPYEENKKYVDFIVGRDENGQNVEYTCNPDKLKEPFDKNSSAPDYLTPVFFEKEVLDKYYKDNNYVVGDGFVRYGYIWELPIDNIRDDNFIVAYLGDLGRNLPDYREQQYWSSFNVVCGAELSPVKYNRDFLAQYAEADNILSLFKAEYLKIKKLSKEKLGFSLYRDLTDEDTYVYRDLSVPSDNSDSDFDNKVLLLAKLMSDALDENKIKKAIEIKVTGTDLSKIKGSISLLEKFLEISRVSEYKEAISKVRNIQKLRSSSSAHTKGENYLKICRELGLNLMSKSQGYRMLLKMAYDFLAFIEKNIDLLK